jgi:hypothetical protein
MKKTCDLEKLRTIFARGLTGGLGTANGQTCIEGAISLACGGGLSDSPACVAEPDRSYAIAINDAAWSSPAARAEALLPLALAQLDTAGRDRTVWARALAEGTIRRVLPIGLRAAGLDAEAERCAREGTADSARSAARAARAAADAYAAAYAATYTASAADAASAAAAARDAADCAAAAAVDADADAAYDAADAAAVVAARASVAAGDAVLRASVAVALDAYAATSV